MIDLLSRLLTPAKPINFPHRSANLSSRVKHQAPIRDRGSNSDRFSATARIHAVAPDETPESLFLAESVTQHIAATIGSTPAESGGMLGGRPGSGVVTEFYADRNGKRSRATYSPDVAEVNRVLKEDWNPRGIRLLGFVHSHPAGFTSPSRGDAVYADRILRAVPTLDRLLLPIVQTVPDTGAFSMHGHHAQLSGSSVAITALDTRSLSPRAPVAFGESFDRVHGAYDLVAMSGSRIVAVGTGGAASFLEDMARCGVGEFVLIDPDTVSATNIGTQQVYRKDLGRAKVTAVAERIVDVSPHAEVWTVQASLDDLDDAAMRRLCLAPLDPVHAAPPSATLVCGFTDNFGAQARVNRIALNLGLAHLSAAVYQEGRGVEIAFAAPGVSTACVRCALRSRYSAYLDQGFQSDVTSHGTPLWATARLNAAKEPIALALLHHQASTDPDHPATRRYKALLDRVGRRNLSITALDPQIGERLGLAMFDALAAADPAGRLVTDQTAWLHQEPDSPANGYPSCPDCGGTGDLADSVGAFSDTRPMPAAFGDYRVA